MSGLALPVDTYSPDQLSELVLELQDLSSAVRDATTQIQGTDAAPDLPAVSPELGALLQKNSVDTQDVATLETLRKEAETALEKAPSIHIMLAAMPGRVMRRQFTVWFRTEIHPLTLITFAARGDLGGGAVVQAGSHLYDLSFRRSILDHRARLTEIAGV